MIKRHQILVTSIITTLLIPITTAFSPLVNNQQNTRHKSFLVKYSEHEDDIDLPKKNTKETTPVRRLSITGVSISPIGFLALLSPNSDDVSSDTTLPIRVSTDPNDAISATSVESLTLMQLLSGVDMAGAILPPQVLHHLVALYCSSTDDKSKAAKEMNRAMSLMLDGVSYVEATAWQRNRVRFPKVQLHTVRLELDSQFSKQQTTKTTTTTQKPIPLSFILECTIDGNPLHLPLSSESSDDGSFLEDATYSYTPATASFLGLSLALRYKTPIIISTSLLDVFSSTENHPDSMPVDTLQRQNDFVTRDINKSFEANRLQGALRIAVERGDKEAERKIRQKLREFDSFEDLPVLNSESEDDDDGDDEMGDGVDDGAWR